jgi:hypothetical protein
MFSSSINSSPLNSIPINGRSHVMFQIRNSQLTDMFGPRNASFIVASAAVIAR